MPAIGRFPCIFHSFSDVIKETLNLFAPVRMKNPAGIYLLKVYNENTRTRCEICPKLIIKTLERRQWRRSGVFIVSFGHILHILLCLYC